MSAFLRQLGFQGALVLAFAGLASACGDAKLPGAATEKAQLVLSAGSTVHMGQAIGASLILPKDSQLETGTLWRTGCNPFHFKVGPETGWHDPWADWYYSGIPKQASALDRPYQPSCGVSGGRPGPMIRIVDGKVITVPEPPPPPPQIGFNLNEWVRFDKPGKYTISLTYRARQPNGKSETWNEEASESFVTLQTDPVEVEVLPESEEASKQAADELAQYITYLDRAKANASNSNAPRFPDKAGYSQSPIVIPLIAQLVAHIDVSFDNVALLNFPDQERVVKALEAQLRKPQTSISTDFLDLLAFTKTRLQHPELFGNRLQNQSTPQWGMDSKVRSAAFLQNMSEYVRRLLSALPTKDGKPQGECLKTVLQIMAHWPLPKKEELRQAVIRESARLLPKMSNPPYVWEEEWREIASPAMVPFLLRTLKSHPPFDEQYQRWLYQVAPLRVQRLMILAMEQGDWSLASSWGHVVQPTPKLSRLADDYVINVLTNYHDDYDNSDEEWVLLKFGTRAAAPSVRKILASQECLGDPPLWAFLLKVDGARAEQGLVCRYQKASSSADCRADAEIYKVVDELDSTQQGRTWRPYWSPALEAIFVSQLGNKDKYTAAWAAELLGLYGSPRVEDTLWAKLEAWHRSSASAREHGESYDQAGEYFEDEVIAALLHGPSWTTHNHFDRLRALCVYACWEVEASRPVGKVQQLVVSNAVFDVAPYSLLGGSPSFPNTRYANGCSGSHQEQDFQSSFRLSTAHCLPRKRGSNIPISGTCSRK